jgi:hypothetical protein
MWPYLGGGISTGQALHLVCMGKVELGMCFVFAWPVVGWNICTGKACVKQVVEA